MIVESTYAHLKSHYGDEIEHLEIEDVRIGVFHTAIKLSNGSYGVSGTLPFMELPCDKKSRDYGVFSPTKIRGQKVTGLFESEKATNIIDTLKVAALNALSSRFLTPSNYHIVEDADPIDLIGFPVNKTITVVGAFHSYIDRISGTPNKLYVLELNENALGTGRKEFYVPAVKYPEILPLSDIVIITGLTLVNHTLDDLLSVILPHTKTVVTGPSGSIIPDALFDRGVSILGAARITDPGLLFSVVGEAGAGFHLHHYCARKICILNDRKA